MKLSGASVVGLEDADPDFMDHRADERSENPFDVAVRRQLFGRMADAIGDLPQAMQQVLSLYYCEGLNLREIGTVLGVTESRVCQIHGEATRRLRATLGDAFFEEASA
jgi:RNA polymerase sigma factor for flagellar operon FliA